MLKPLAFRVEHNWVMNVNCVILIISVNVYGQIVYILKKDTQDHKTIF